MIINGTPIRRNTTCVVINEQDNKYWGPAGTVISQCKSFDRACKTYAKWGHSIYSIDYIRKTGDMVSQLHGLNVIF